MNAEQLDLWLALADRFGAADMRVYRSEAGKHTTVHPMGPVHGRDPLRAERRAQQKADAEAEARRNKRIAAIAEAVDGPAMQRTQFHTGERNTDCARYSGCLDAFVARHCQRSDAHAACPTGCAYYQRERLSLISRRDSPLATGAEVIG